MGREREKRKNKSSFPKVKHKPKSKKLNLKGHPLIAQKWYCANLHIEPSIFSIEIAIC